MFTIIGILLIAIGVGVAVFLQGLRRIPAEPPQVALATFLGGRIQIVKKEGWRFFFIYPYLFGYIPIEVTKVNMTPEKDLDVQRVRTPDLAEIDIPISVTWTPDKESAKALIEFVNSGKEAGVKTILEGIIKEKLRQWALSTEEGPSNFREAIGAQEEVVAVLLKAIVGDKLSPIESGNVSTTALLKYFSKPQKQPNMIEKGVYGDNWEEIDDYLKNLEPEDRQKLEGQVNDRANAIRGIRQGNGKIGHPSLGIVINRLNIGEIKLFGKVAEAAELKVKEEQEREAEKVEMEHIQSRVKIFVDTGFSPEKALEIVQTERGKVVKTISEKQLNISPETREMIKEVTIGVAGLFVKNTGDKGEKS